MFVAGKLAFYFKLQHDSRCELKEVHAQLGLAVVAQLEKGRANQER
jgi:hypothetical protein